MQNLNTKRSIRSIMFVKLGDNIIYVVFFTSHTKSTISPVIIDLAYWGWTVAGSNVVELVQRLWTAVECMAAEETTD